MRKSVVIFIAAILCMALVAVVLYSWTLNNETHALAFDQVVVAMVMYFLLPLCIVGSAMDGGREKEDTGMEKK